MWENREGQWEYGIWWDKEKGKGKRMRVSGRESAEVIEQKEKWKGNKRKKTENSRTISEVLMKGMLKDELKARNVRNELNGSCWCVRPLDPTNSPGGWGKKRRERRVETLTLHYLCSTPLVQAHAASHCVFIEQPQGWGRGNTTRRAVCL